MIQRIGRSAPSNLRIFRYISLGCLAAFGPAFADAPEIAPEVISQARAELPAISSPDRSTETETFEQSAKIESLAPFITMRAVPGEGVPIAVIAPSGSHSSDVIYLAGLPRGSHVTDGVHEVVADVEGGLINVTGWKLSEISVAAPPGMNRIFTVSAVLVSKAEDEKSEFIARALLSVEVIPERSPASPVGLVDGTETDVSPAAQQPSSTRQVEAEESAVSTVQTVGVQDLPPAAQSTVLQELSYSAIVPVALTPDVIPQSFVENMSSKARHQSRERAFAEKQESNSQRQSSPAPVLTAAPLSLKPSSEIFLRTAVAATPSGDAASTGMGDVAPSSDVAALAAEVFIPEAPANLRSEPQPPVAAPAT
ncbi:hypothetical protein, partial [Methylobacterium soli]